MKTRAILILIFFAVLLTGCGSPWEIHNSPNSNYVIEIGPKFNSYRLILKLYDKDKNFLEELDTEASDVMKWSLNWYNDTTIVLHSHDIGTYAWIIDKNNKLVESSLTDEINMGSVKAFNNKYHQIEHGTKECLASVSLLNKQLEDSKSFARKSDSVWHMTINRMANYKIYGYEMPDTTSQKLLILSMFTEANENNPHNLRPGNFYDTATMENLMLKYQEKVGDFIKVFAIDNRGNSKLVFLEKEKWGVFEQ